MAKVQRFDRLTTRFDIVTAPTAPEPGRGTAIWTPEGYLLVDAYTCRDGLLPYSNGRETWLEYRPAEELRKALPTFSRLPVTDDHPKSMVSAETWADVARGMGGDTPRIVVDGGVTYIRDLLKITAKELLDKLERPGGPRCVSIGFLSDVLDIPGTYQGRRYQFMQAGLIGNHDAIVLEGRAGDVCRIYMDSAAWTVGQEEKDEMPESKKPAPASRRNDNLGTPITETTIIAPDGSEHVVPTFIAEELAELQMLRAKMGAEPEMQAPAAPAAAPVQPAAPAAPPAAPAAPKEPEEDEGGTMPEDKKKDASDEEAEKMKDKKDKDESLDSLRAEFTRRNRMERRALRAGLDDAHIDRTDDTDQLARDIITARMPWTAGEVKQARDDALDLLVETAMKMPEDVTRASKDSAKEFVEPDPQPFGQWKFKKTDAADEDPVDAAVAKYATEQGY